MLFFVVQIVTLLALLVAIVGGVFLRRKLNEVLRSNAIVTAMLKDLGASVYTASGPIVTARRDPRAVKERA